MLDIGTKVRIKSWEEIQKTLDKEGCCDGLYFNPQMKDYCGTVCAISQKSPNMYQRMKGFFWNPQWFDVVEEAGYLNDGSIEQRSLCLALIRQTMSGNGPDIKYLRDNISAFPHEVYNGFFYRDYPQDKWEPCTRIAKNIPDWPCLKLKPEILEEAIKNCLSQNDLEYLKKCVDKNISAWFIFNKTEKSNFWYEVSRALYHVPEISKATNVKQPYKTKKDEIKFQRKKGCILRGTVPEGNQQSSGKCKTTTCSGHLGHQVCTGR